MNACLLFAVVAASAAQTNSAPEPNWGTAATSAIRVPAAAFTPRRGVALWDSNGTGNRFRTSQTIGGTVVNTDTFFDAAVDLPAGALITGVRFDYCDSDPASAVFCTFQSNVEPAGDSTTSHGSVFSSGTPGCASMQIDLSGSPVAFDHVNRSYWVRFQLGTLDNSHQVRGALVFYKLQVSPSPATATFSDVPTSHQLFQFIEALAASGITAGCNASPPQFCPDATLTRGQMAVFLARALGLHFAP